MKDYTAGKAWKIAKQQHILKIAFQLFSDKEIETVTIPDVSEASGVGRATVYRYFPTKMDLVSAVGVWGWETYIKDRLASYPKEGTDQMTGEGCLTFFLDSFLDLFINHPDLLRFTYNFKSYFKQTPGSGDQEAPFTGVVHHLAGIFHDLYERGMKDGTLRSDISEEAMFSGAFRIMMSQAASYAQGTLYEPDKQSDPVGELTMLKELLLTRFLS